MSQGHIPSSKCVGVTLFQRFFLEDCYLFIFKVFSRAAPNMLGLLTTSALIQTFLSVNALYNNLSIK